MKIDSTNLDRNFNTIPVSKFWNVDAIRETEMHRIHAYPAKFPSLVVKKSIEYAKKNGVEINKLADVFCGCGTTALEAKRHNIDFWGCDINPVATLITRAKSEQYDTEVLNKYYLSITSDLLNEDRDVMNEFVDHERISYWFHDSQINKVNLLLNSSLATFS